MVDARLCTAAGFAAVGLAAATWAGRVPAVQARLDLTPADLAVVVAGLEGGALLGLPLGARLVAAWGSRRATRLGFCGYAPGLLAAPFAPDTGWLAAGLAAWAAANSVLDVALNAQGVAVEQARGRPTLSALHAAQGVGLLVGAGLATAAAWSAVPLSLHASAVAVVCLLVGLAATRTPVQSPPTGPVPRRTARPDRRLLAVGAVAFCAFLVDGAATSWTAVHLHEVHGAGPGLSAAGYLGFATALVLGRSLGDRWVLRWSRPAVARACGAGIVAGTALALSAPGGLVALGGWALVGLALGPLAPTVLGAAARVSDRPVPAAVATVSTIGYLGSFTGPPVIGLLAGGIGLSVALTGLALAGLTAALLAPALAPRDR